MPKHPFARNAEEYLKMASQVAGVAVDPAADMKRLQRVEALAGMCKATLTLPQDISSGEGLLPPAPACATTITPNDAQRSS